MLHTRRISPRFEHHPLELGHSPGSPCSPIVVAAAARRLGLASRSIYSGAGHEAQAMSAITAAGMVCVPSMAGIRHSLRESSSPEDGAKGANGLLNARLIGDEA